MAVVLSNGKAIDDNDIPAMLKMQYRILMRLSRLRKNDAQLQKLVADANMLGLEVADRINEANGE